MNGLFPEHRKKMEGSASAMESPIHESGTRTGTMHLTIEHTLELTEKRFRGILKVPVQ